MRDAQCCNANRLLENRVNELHMTIISSAHLLLPLARRECSPLEVLPETAHSIPYKPGHARLFFA